MAMTNAERQARWRDKLKRQAAANDIDLTLIRRALDEADEALGSLRRCHGLDVTELCYPAHNTVGEALRHLTARGVLEDRDSSLT